MHILSICSRRTFEKTSMLKVSLYLPPSPPLSHTLSLSLSHIASFFETPQLLPRLPPDHFPLMLSFLLWRPCQSARWASRSAACWMREVQTCRFSEARARLRFGTSSVLIPETRHMHTHVFTHAHTHTHDSVNLCAFVNGGSNSWQSVCVLCVILRVHTLMDLASAHLPPSSPSISCAILSKSASSRTFSPEDCHRCSRVH